MDLLCEIFIFGADQGPVGWDSELECLGVAGPVNSVRDGDL